MFLASLFLHPLCLPRSCQQSNSQEHGVARMQLLCVAWHRADMVSQYFFARPQLPPHSATWFSGILALPRSPLQALPHRRFSSRRCSIIFYHALALMPTFLSFKMSSFQLLLTCCSTSAVCLYLELDAGIPGLRKHALWPHGILRILMAVRMKELQHKTRPLQWLQLSPSSPFHAVYGCCNIPPACGEGECE